MCLMGLWHTMEWNRFVMEQQADLANASRGYRHVEDISKGCHWRRAVCGCDYSKFYFAYPVSTSVFGATGKLEVAPPWLIRFSGVQCIKHLP